MSLKEKEIISQLYELSPAQEVVKLQCKYTLFKRVINILSSATTNENIDIDIMKEALNIVIDRNDCLRIRFVKQDGKLMQYFLKEFKIDNIQYIEFKTKQEQDKFMLDIRKKAIDYMKGVVIEPYFCKTFDNKFMIVLKVCHLILDIYGLNMIYKDLFEVYNSLKNGGDLPESPGSFETLLIKDLKVKNNNEIKKRNTEFFTNYLKEREAPYYAGLHGYKEPTIQKQLSKNRHTSKMFLVHNDTNGYMYHIDKEIVDKVANYCLNTKCSISNFFFYAMSICASKLNNNVKNMLPLELCNCRGTVLEKKTAGTKAQSVACYTVVDGAKTFEENFMNFCKEQSNLYRYVGFSDQEFQMLLHKIYNEPVMNTFYSIAYSFIPIQKNKDVDIQIYSNGKCALPAYIAIMWDIDTNYMDVLYDCYVKTHKEKDIERFHKSYLKILEQIVENQKIKIKDIEV